MTRHREPGKALPSNVYATRMDNNDHFIWIHPESEETTRLGRDRATAVAAGRALNNTVIKVKEAPAIEEAEIPCTRLVSKRKYCADSGLTNGQVRGKIQRGVWIRGVHYYLIDGGISIDAEQVEEWVRSGGTGQREVGSRSKLSKRVRTGRGAKQIAQRPIV